MNTCIEYIYSDANNYKSYGSVVLAGEISNDDINGIKSALYDSEFFIPAVVGLEQLNRELGAPDVKSDHPFHTIENITSTDASPSQGYPSAREFAEAMASMTQKKWELAGTDWQTITFGEKATDVAVSMLHSALKKLSL